MPRLQHKYGYQLNIGDVVETFRGEKVKLRRINPPSRKGAQAKVFVSQRALDGIQWEHGTREFFASVLNAIYEE